MCCPSFLERVVACVHYALVCVSVLDNILHPTCLRVMCF